jgi:capsid protein
MIGKIASRFGINWDNVGDGAIQGGGIDAVDQSGKRRRPSGSTRSLDAEVNDYKRKRITLTSRSVHRNFEVPAWAIRKHLDFVSRFSFSMKSDIPAFNEDVEGFMKWWARAENCSSDGRLSLGKSIRLAEASRTLDGDVFFLKLGSGQIQAIEGDRIKTPSNRRDRTFDRDNTYNGIEVNPRNGKPGRYAVHARGKGGTGLEFDKWIRASRIIPHGYFDRFDQYRGYSPVTASLNRYQDSYEGLDYALARAKVAQLFGLVFTRDVEEQGMGKRTGEDTSGDGNPDRWTTAVAGKNHLLDMDPGEDAKFLENKTPAPEFQKFQSMMIGVALKSLDLPYSFYDASVGNFFGNKAELTLYLQSVREKREDVKNLLRLLTIWRLRLAIEDGDIIVPRSIRTLDDFKFQWTPAGIPWFDPRDIRGDIDAIKAGLRTREEVRQDRFGDSWTHDVAPQLRNEQNLIEELELRLTMEADPFVDPRDSTIIDVE